jgi:uncharacterized protein (DUF2062 family)
MMQIKTVTAKLNRKIITSTLGKFSLVQFKEQMQTALQADASPHQIAKGFAVGTFISLLPMPGIDFLVATGLLAIFKQLNKVAIYSAFAVWNTLVVAPLYVLSSKLGALAFTTRPFHAFDWVFGTYLNETVKYFLVGNLVLALTLTAVSYILVQTAVSLHQNRNRKTPCKVIALS